MKKNRYLMCAIVMLLIAIIFILYALMHPEYAWTIPLPMVWIIYGVYLVVMVVMFIISFKR